MSEAAAIIIAIFRAGIDFQFANDSSVACWTAVIAGLIRRSSILRMDRLLHDADGRTPPRPTTSTHSLPIFRDFTEVMDPKLFTPLPGDWVVGVADVVQSTKAIAENRYKAVNMAGAAVIVAVTNAMAGRDFPFVFGGDGASFAVPAAAGPLARQALAETATWVKEDLDLTLRIGMAPVAAIRAQGLDVRVARYAPSENISIAMFSGGGMAWADSAMKHGEIAVAAGAARRASRSLRAVVPLRGNPGLARAGAVARRRARRGREAETLPRRDRADRPHRRENARRVAAGAGPAAALHLAAGGRRSRGARLAPRRRVALRAQDQGAGAGRFCISWSCVSASRSAASFRRNTPAS